MIAFWKIRFFDFSMKEWKDRFLAVDSRLMQDSLKYKFELLLELEEHYQSREILEYRQCFNEITEKEFLALFNSESLKVGQRFPRIIYLHDYTEDEEGKSLDRERLGEALTGKQGVTVFPSHYRTHDIEYHFADKSYKIDFSQIHLDESEFECLKWFIRDVKEIKKTRFMAEGPGSLNIAGNEAPKLRTSTTADEIRSFIMVFRRLYAAGEKGNFLKATGKVFARRCRHPIANWVTGERREYTKKLQNPAGDIMPFAKKVTGLPHEWWARQSD